MGLPCVARVVLRRANIDARDEPERRAKRAAEIAIAAGIVETAPTPVDGSRVRRPGQPGAALLLILAANRLGRERPRRAEVQPAVD